MRKIITITIMSIIFCQGYSKSINYGFGAGLNYTSLNLRNPFDLNSKYKIGFQVNGMLEYSWSDNYGIRIEPGYASRGGSGSTVSYSNIKIHLNYVTIPMLFRYSLLDKFQILLGPECSYLLSSKSLSEDNSITASFLDKKIDFGVNYGISYKMYGNFEIGLRGNIGLISAISDLEIFQYDIVDSYNGKGLYNQGMAISIIYMLK